MNLSDIGRNYNGEAHMNAKITLLEQLNAYYNGHADTDEKSAGLPFVYDEFEIDGPDCD